MIKIAIVEDEMVYVETLKSYLARYEKDHSVSFQVQVFTDGLILYQTILPATISFCWIFR